MEERLNKKDFPATSGSTMKSSGDKQARPGAPAKPTLQELVERQSGGKRCSLEDFRFLKVLGKGSFGKVRISKAISKFGS